MRIEDGEHREARADAPMTISSRPPLPPDNTDTISEPPAPSAPGEEPSATLRPRRRLSIMAALAGFVLVVTVLILLTDAGRTTAGTTATAKVSPTATATPSPTATVIPSPTAMPGFKVYTDLPDSFVLQYPNNWVYHPIEPSLGVEFDDSDSNSNYTMQVLVPGDATTPGPGASVDDASAWVQYEMDRLATVPGTLQRETGPIPARTVGGQVWQSGIARISQGTTVIRVQVYATVLNGKPYIINVLAVDDRFSAGSQLFFDPMLGSFQFLPPTP